MNNPRFSVWTATYNRAEFLKRLYISLKNQTFKDFEWIVIDDGSTDETEAVVKRFNEEGILESIRYIKKENGGKHTAWKLATELFKATYVITIDSDDTLLPNALEIFDEHWKVLERSADYSNYWEIKGRCQFENGKLIGKRLPKKLFDAYSDEMTFKLGFKSEMHACRKTSVLRNEAVIPDDFIFQGECSNFSEGIRWSRAGRRFKTRYVNEMVRVYYFDATDTLTKKRGINSSRKIAYNTLVQTKFALEERWREMLKWDQKHYLKTFVLFLLANFRTGENFLDQRHKFNVHQKFALIILYVPVKMFSYKYK